MEIENCKLKIGINGYFLSRPFTGFGVYTNGYLNALQKIAAPEKFEFMVYTSEKPPQNYQLPVRIKVIPESKKYGASLGKIIWEQKYLIKEAKKDQVKLIHHFYPSTVVFDKGVKQLTSIHDATPWHFTEHNKSLKTKLFRKFVVWSNRKADKIISVSQYGKDDVATIFNLPKEKIDYIYNGIDNSFRRKITDSGKQRVVDKYHLFAPYIFYIGGFEVHKNVKRLFLAFARVASEIKHNLVIAGGVFSRARVDVYQDFFELPKLIKNYKLEKRVQLIGVVPNEDLPALFQSADLFVMPSLAEGFNLPLAQAFASKVPTIASDTTASREIASGASLLVDGTNVEAMGAKMAQLLYDKKKQNILIATGLDRQRQFVWEDSVKRLLEIYKQIIAK